MSAVRSSSREQQTLFSDIRQTRLVNARTSFSWFHVANGSVPAHGAIIGIVNERHRPVCPGELAHTAKVNEMLPRCCCRLLKPDPSTARRPTKRAGSWLLGAGPDTAALGPQSYAAGIRSLNVLH